ncbi:MAG TPA: S8 family serine peptidase, partial [Anaerolineales bacterium]|nr:S8 family serine peptidase [Anaerolineales bacterium]
MNTRNIVHVLVLLSLLVPFVSTVPVLASEAQQDSGPGAYVPGEVVVGFTPGRDLPLYVEGATALAASVGGQVLRVSSTGAALLRLPAGADVEGVARSLSSTRGVIFAEPNFIYSVPDPVIEDRHGNPDYSRDVDKDGEVRVVPTQLLRSMKSIRRGKTQTTYPSDPMLWWNNGWDWMQADYIWPNTTVAKNVCVLDTGVDYLHKDLTTTRVLKGKDWVNNDVDPMDDNGHGTHIAGIISALGNNKEGISGVSNGKVVAVKVIGAQGWGTNFDISQGIYECANRTDVNVLNMSFGGSDESTLMQAAIDWAVNTKGKLVVAAAGNDGSSSPIFPAGWSADFPGKLMAVGALGKWIPVDWDEDLVVDWY